MKSLSDHLAPTTQRNGAVLQRLVIHLQERKSQYIFDTPHSVQKSGKARRQENTVGGHPDSPIHEKPPPPAVWWLWQAGAGWRLCAEIRRLPGWRWESPCGGPGPHTYWGVGCLDGHSTGRAERGDEGKSLKSGKYREIWYVCEKHSFVWGAAHLILR